MALVQRTTREDDDETCVLVTQNKIEVVQELQAACSLLAGVCPAWLGPSWLGHVEHDITLAMNGWWKILGREGR